MQSHKLINYAWLNCLTKNNNKIMHDWTKNPYFIWLICTVRKTESRAHRIFNIQFNTEKETSVSAIILSIFCTYDSSNTQKKQIKQKKQWR